MAIKVFVTGATGYIGGDALFVITDKHPEWEVTCLVRNSDKGAKVAMNYAGVHLVYGDLDMVNLIEEESSKADIVYRYFANCDHEPSANAIARGLARRTSQTPGFWIHTSGSRILAQETIENNLYGEETSKVFDDWDGITELINLPHEAPHRNVDEIVLATSTSNPSVKTAIVCPCTIYGVGRGPDNQRSIQVPYAAQTFLKEQKATQIGNGRNVWHQIHIHDLSQLYLLLGEAAVNGGDPASWDDEGYYLAENGEFVWGEILKEIARVAFKKGLLPSEEIVSLSIEDMAVIDPSGNIVGGIGSNSRGVSIRAKKLLGWQPREKSLKEEIPQIVDEEARRLGLITGHASKVESAKE